MLWAHEKVVEGLFNREHERVIGGGESLQLGRVFHDLFRGFDTQGFRQSGIPLALSAFGYTLELNSLPGQRVRRASSASCTLAHVPARTSLIDGGAARFVFWTG